MLRRFLMAALLVPALMVSSAFAAEKITVASDPTWPPMEFLDDNKQVVGYDVDMIKAVAKEAGMEAEVRMVAWDGIFGAVGDGVMSMYDITVISIIVAALLGIVRVNGGIAFILNFIRRRIKSSKGAEFGIAGLSLLVDACTANNTVAIVMAAPIAKTISEEYGIKSTKTASLLDIFGSVVQGLLPYGAQMVTAVSLTAVSAGAILPYLFYPYLLALSSLAFMIIPSFVKKK